VACQERPHPLDRATRLLGTADRSQTLIEIGPGYNPLAPKAAGWRTHIVDHAPREELRTKYAAAGVNIDVIEEVDTIWSDGPLHESVPSNLMGRVDTILASHVLEHIPDPIGFLQSASHLVTPLAVLSLALPDRRYCFDCFKPWTTTGDWLEAHRRRPSRHNLKTRYDQIAYAALLDGQLAWGPGHTGVPTLADPFEVARETVRTLSAGEDNSYQDCHAWQFSPAGFRLIMLELRSLGLTDWRIESMHLSDSFEFFVSLSRSSGGDEINPSALQRERQRLLLRQLTETREQIDTILDTQEAVTEDRLGYEALIAKFDEQDVRLRTMAESIASICRAIRPLRTIWRAITSRH
jgi:hypothetical protein